MRGFRILSGLVVLGCVVSVAWGISTRRLVATEICNAIDDDLDGTVDEGCPLSNNFTVDTGHRRVSLATHGVRSGAMSTASDGASASGTVVVNTGPRVDSGQVCTYVTSVANATHRIQVLAQSSQANGRIWWSVGGSMTGPFRVGFTNSTAQYITAGPYTIVTLGDIALNGTHHVCLMGSLGVRMDYLYVMASPFPDPTAFFGGGGGAPPGYEYEVLKANSAPADCTHADWVNTPNVVFEGYTSGSYDNTVTWKRLWTRAGSTATLYECITVADTNLRASASADETMTIFTDDNIELRLAQTRALTTTSYGLAVSSAQPARTFDWSWTSGAAQNDAATLTGTSAQATLTGDQDNVADDVGYTLFVTYQFPLAAAADDQVVFGDLRVFDSDASSGYKNFWQPTSAGLNQPSEWAGFLLSSTLATPPDTAPPVFSALTETNLTHNSVTLGAAVDKANTSVRVLYGTTSGNYTAASAPVNCTGTCSRTLTGLTPAVQYFYQWEGTPQFGAVGTSAEGDITTSVAPLPDGVGIGSRVLITAVPANVRSAAAGSIIGTQAVNMRGTLVAGPTVSGATYWQVDHDSGIDGWVDAADFRLFPAPTLVSSAWTTPLPTTPNVVADSASWVGFLAARTSLSISNSQFGRTFWIAGPSAPTVNVGASCRDCDVSQIDRVPLEDWMRPAGYEQTSSGACGNSFAPPGCYRDAHMVVLSNDRTIVWEFYQAIRVSATSWTAGNIRKYVLTEGFPSTTPAASPRITPVSTHIGPGLMLAESLRYEEVRAGLIQHALGFVAQHSSANHNGWHPLEVNVSGNNSNAFATRIGMRFQLNPAYDIAGQCATRPVPTSCVAILTALRDYGMIYTDQTDGSSFDLNAETLTFTPLASAWGALVPSGTIPTDVKSNLRLIETVPTPVWACASCVGSAMDVRSVLATGASVSLTLSAAQSTPSISGYTWRYTTDGSEPTTSSTAYSGAISHTAAGTLYAKGFKTNSLPSGAFKLNMFAVGNVVRVVEQAAAYNTATCGSLVNGEMVARGATGTVSSGPILAADNGSGAAFGWWKVNFGSGDRCIRSTYLVWHAAS